MSKSLTGTERYAAEVTRELVDRGDLELELHVPKDAVVPEWAQASKVVRSRFTGMLFEQVSLPFAAKNAHLLNLSGPAPLLRRNQSVVLFDASVFRYPKTFSRGFVLWYTVLYWVLSRTATHVFTISEFSAREISQVVHVPRSRLVVATCGAEHALRGIPSRPDLAVPDKYVVCVGTLAPRKNLLPITRALTEDGIHVVVVGAAGKSAIFGNEVGGGGNSKYLTFAGRLTDDEIAWLLDHAVALVFPSLYEGFGLPVIEAQIRGCPVVCADRSSLPEVTDGSALMFNPDEPKRAVTLVRGLSADAQLRSTLSEAGKANAARYTWGDAAETIARTIGQSGVPR